MQTGEGFVSKGSNLSKTADFNKSVILDAIRRLGDNSSRVALAKVTGLSTQTVSNICKKLIEAGLIRESGEYFKTEGKGKPRTVIELIPDSRFAVGVHIDPSVISTVLVDFRGNLIRKEEFETSPNMSPEGIVKKIAAQINTIISSPKIDRSKILGIGIASPGPINQELGVVMDPPNLMGWHRVPLRNQISKATGLPVVLDKDSVAAAVGELWSDTENYGQDFLFVYTGIGIGLGIVIGGEVYRGTSGNSGEIGQIKVSDSANVKGKKISGNLETLLQPISLVEEAERKGVLPENRVGNSPKDITTKFHELQLLARSGNAAAQEIFSRAVQNFAKAVGLLTNIFDIRRVVFGGPFWPIFQHLYLPNLPRLVTEHSSLASESELRMSSSNIGSNVVAIGAACLVLDNVFSPRSGKLVFDS